MDLVHGRNGKDINSIEWGPIKKWLLEACNADFSPGSGNSPAQGRFGCRGGLDAIARMAGVHCAGALPVSSAWREGLHQADGAQQGQRGVVVAAALWHGILTPHGGVGDRGIEFCTRRVLTLYHSGIVPGGALVLSVYMHTGAGLTQENWQILSMIGQWLTSQALQLIIGGDFQVEPMQLEGSGWVRAVGGFVVAPQLATVTQSHRVIDFFVVS